MFSKKESRSYQSVVLLKITMQSCTRFAFQVVQKFSCYCLVRSSVKPHDNGTTQWMQLHLFSSQAITEECPFQTQQRVLLCLIVAARDTTLELHKTVLADLKEDVTCAKDLLAARLLTRGSCLN